jgi:hypothetical protein
MVKVHGLPSGRLKIGLMSGTRSPIFQPNRSAAGRPTIAPVRSSNQALFWSSGTTYSGYIRRNGSGSTAMFENVFVSCW